MGPRTSPRSSLARGSVVGKAVVKASARRARLILSEPFRSETEHSRAAEQADEQIAKILFDACSVLRGTALKLAQVLATEHEMLPPAYRAQFARAAHGALPINRALLRRVLKAELGDWHTHFAEFCDVPFAAASLGQVHAATSRAGQQLAVKVQYPGVAEGVASDLRLVSIALAPTRWGHMVESCIGELRERLGEELDYTLEADHTEWFRKHLQNSRVSIPEVYRQHSTRHVLVTERLPGLHLTAWLANNPTREAKEHYAQLLVELFHECAFELGFIHADPNFGNYLFGEDGRLGLIDFGCVRRVDAKGLDAMRRAYALHDAAPETIEQIHAEMGIRYRADVPRDQLCALLVGWANWLAEPYRTESFDFGQSDYFERGALLGRSVRQLVDSCSGAFLYFGRAQQGLFRLLQALGVSVRMPRPR